MTQPPKPTKQVCPDCGKLCKSIGGLTTHMNAMHLTLSPSQLNQAKKSIQPTSEQELEPTWRKEFIAKFVHGEQNKWIGDDDAWLEADFEEVMDFIGELLYHQRQQVIDEVKALIEGKKLLSIAKYGNMPAPHDKTYKEGYNNALETLLEALKGK